MDTHWRRPSSSIGGGVISMTTAEGHRSCQQIILSIDILLFIIKNALLLSNKFYNNNILQNTIIENTLSLAVCTVNAIINTNIYIYIYTHPHV